MFVRLRCFIACIPALFVFFAAPQFSANAEELLLPACQNLYVDSKIGCDIRFSDPLSRPNAINVEVSWPPSVTKELTTYSVRNNSDVTAWLFVITTTELMRNGRQTATQKAIQDDMRKLLAGANPNHAIGLATISDEFSLLARIGSTKNAVDDALKKVTLDGGPMEMYRRLLSALEVLDAYPGASRKALVFLSNGDTEDKEENYFRGLALRLAQSRGIAIFAVGYPTRLPATLQRLDRLAAETNGNYVEADKETRRMPNEFIDTLYAKMDNGGYVTFPIRAQPDIAEPRVVLTANLVGGRSLSAMTTITSYTPRYGIVAWWDRQENWLKYTYGGVGVCSALFLIGLVTMMLRRRNQDGHDDRPITRDSSPMHSGVGATAVLAGDSRGGTMVGGTNNYGSFVGNSARGGGYAGPTTPLTPNQPYGATNILAGNGSGQIYAWLTRADTSEQIPIRETAVRIGRHDDNDLKLEDDSVHRRHAVVHITPQREFVITDLSGAGGNHVFVNGQKVEKRTLRDGDEITLGKVRLRLKMATV
jgi:FHA domain-containing protein/von Willebrand factor type A domain-containing protein